MKAPAEIVITINEDGSSRVQILRDPSPNHFLRLKPMLNKLSDGEASRIDAHRADHTHGSAHEHDHAH